MRERDEGEMKERGWINDGKEGEKEEVIEGGIRWMG